MNTSLKKQLKRYSALSAGLISCAANAQVVETDIRDEVTLFNSSYNVDVDGDGLVDFVFSHYYSTYGAYSFNSFLEIGGVNSNSIIGFTSYTYSSNMAVKLYPNTEINSLNSFLSSGVLLGVRGNGLSIYTTSTFGHWIADCSDNYVGVKFDINGNTHYGWIRIVVNDAQEFYIAKWGYESQPDTPITTPEITDKSANNILIKDIGKNSDASDIQISFNKAKGEFSYGTTEYRVFLSKTNSYPSITNSNYHAVTMDGSPSYTVNLASNFTDTDGDLIVVGETYYAFIMGYYYCEGRGFISNSYVTDNEITLDVASLVQSITANDISDNLNATDLEVTFDKASDEGTVESYRCFVVKEGDAFNLSYAQTSTNYKTVTPDGSNQYAVNYLSNDIDTDGDIIVENQTYEVYVLSMADGTNATTNALSAPSNAVTLTSPDDTDTPVGVNEVNGIRVTVYPNPTAGMLKLDMGDISNINESQILISDLTGKVLYNQEITSKQMDFDLGSQPSGAYVLAIRINGVSKEWKIIKME